MIPVTTFAAKRVALFGLGGSGFATARALKDGGCEVIVADDDAVAVARAGAEGFATADLTTLDWTGVGALVLAPGVPLTHKDGQPFTHPAAAAARVAGAEVIGDIELFCRERAARAPDSAFIAITGTNGKSTTTALIAHILRAAGLDVQMGGNIGRPVLDLEPPSREHPRRVHVIEVSSFQIDLAPSLAPSIAVLLNITPDHLDRHGSMAAYTAIKERMLARARTQIVSIDDDAGIATCGARVEADLIEISTQRRPRHGVAALGTRIEWVSGKATTLLADIANVGSLRGRHNAQNACAAAAAASVLAVEPATIAQAMQTFPGLPHRMEEVAREGRVLFINDSKATNADSTEKALLSFPRAIHWIVGGVMKEGGIAPLARLFPRLAKAYLIGASSDAFAATLKGMVAFEACGALANAVMAAARDAAASSDDEPVVLLSPACASYDQFKNFEMRGDLFRKLVKEMVAANAASRTSGACGQAEGAAA